MLWAASTKVNAGPTQIVDQLKICSVLTFCGVVGSDFISDESPNIALEVPPGSPHRNAHVAYIHDLADHFCDFVKNSLQHGESQNIGGHSRSVGPMVTCSQQA